MSHWPPPRSNESSSAPAARQLGLFVFLGSVSALFLATLAAVLITRFQALDWPRGRIEALRPGLLLATVALAGTSVALEYSRRALAQNGQQRLVRGLWSAAACAAAFLLLQGQNLLHAWAAVDARANLYSFAFSLITGVHALHVLGGLVPLGWVIQRAARREYSSSRFHGVSFCAQYWHFLGLVWLLILAVLLWL